MSLQASHGQEPLSDFCSAARGFAATTTHRSIEFSMSELRRSFTIIAVGRPAKQEDHYGYFSILIHISGGSKTLLALVFI